LFSLNTTKGEAVAISEVGRELVFTLGRTEEEAIQVGVLDGFLGRLHLEERERLDVVGHDRAVQQDAVRSADLPARLRDAVEQSVVLRRELRLVGDLFHTRHNAAQGISYVDAS